MSDQKSLLKKLKQHGKAPRQPSQNRLRQSVDALAISQNRDLLQDELALSVSSFGTSEDSSDDVMGQRLQMRQTAPAIVSSFDSADSFVIPLDTTDARLWKVMTNEMVGGKALGLAQMIAHTRLQNGQVTVPRAAVITVVAYDLLMKQEGLYNRLESLLQTDTVDETELKAIRNQIVDSKLPESVERQISNFVASFSPTVHFAVRSSSTAEDSGAASFAGQYETLLNVDRAQVVRAVKQCYASMFEARIFSYRKNLGFSSIEKLSMAVVVQHQIDSVSAGVAFSLDPVSGDESVVVVESVHGQGEGLVGGTVSKQLHECFISLRILF